MTPLPLPLRVENVKIRENSDKNQGTPYNPFLKIENIDKFAGLFPVKDKRTPPSASKMYKIIFSFKSTD